MDETASIVTSKLWKDYGRNQLLVTLGGTSSNALAAALPIFLQFVGSQAWNVLRLAFWHWHYRRYTSARVRGQQDQMLLLIRNSSGGWDLTLSLLTQWKRWSRFLKDCDHKANSRPPWFIIALSLIHFVFWPVVGVMTARIWSPSIGISDQALIHGSCGMINLFNTSSVEDRLQYTTYLNNETVMADVYTRQCYGNDTPSTGQCDFFAEKSLGATVTQSTAPCPFGIGEQICITPDSSAYVIDSGFLSSSRHLGINYDDHNSIAFRKVSTCSPITSIGRADIVNYNQTTDTQIWPNDTQLTRYYYGRIVDGSGNGSIVSNWTYEYSHWKPEHNYNYDISAFSYSGGAPLPVWLPNATFWNTSRIDADVALFFVNADHVEYQYPNNDLIFGTGQSFTMEFDNTSSTQYAPDFGTTVLACLDQYQVCGNPTATSTSDLSCSPLAASYQLASDIFDLKLTAVQLAIAQRIVRMFPTLSTYSAVNNRGSAAFLATTSLDGVLQTAQLPDDQWKLEVQHWFLLCLARLQQQVVDYAALPPSAAIRAKATTPTNSADTAMCSAQRVRLPHTCTNFSFVGIIVSVVVGAAVWLLGYLAETVIDAILACAGGEQRRLEWIAQGPAGMQRLALVAAGHGTWGHENTDTPTWLPRSQAAYPLVQVSPHGTLELT